jgi:hypothetical protein
MGDRQTDYTLFRCDFKPLDDITPYERWKTYATVVLVNESKRKVREAR